MLRIILVEDSAPDAQIVRMALEQAGTPVEIMVLDDGLAALEFLTRNDAQPAALQWDLVLLDLNLPTISGFELLERIRASEGLKTLPVLVMSGSSNPTDINRCYRAGANSYICKPPHLADLFFIGAQLVAYWSICVKLPSKRSGGLESTAPARGLSAAGG
jgi:two-component system, chemotaxis family, response regulator Rcp1